MSAGTPAGAWTRWHLGVRELVSERPLCLALANTRQRRHAGAPVERLHTFADLLRFAEHERIVDAAQASALALHAEQRTDAAQAELAATLELREALFRVFAARARRTDAPGADVAIVMASFLDALAALALELRGGQLVPTPRYGAVDVDVVRLQCAVSGVALICGAHAGDVKECADDRGCGRLFVDVTRNRSRRYCLSGECGNRARQAAYRERHRPMQRARSAR
jgi:predicted RNA-binding Zn ribbon-like protein